MVVLEVLGHRQHQIRERHWEEDVGVQVETLHCETAQASPNIGQ